MTRALGEIPRLCFRLIGCRVQHLQGHDPVEHAIAGPEHGPHAALADFVEQFDTAATPGSGAAATLHRWASVASDNQFTTRLRRTGVGPPADTLPRSPWSPGVGRAAAAENCRRARSQEIRHLSRGHAEFLG